MSTGLEQLLASSAEEDVVNQREFKLASGRLGRGEDVPAKTLGKICDKAGKTPADLQNEVEQHAKPLVLAVEVIEESRALFEEAEQRIAVVHDRQKVIASKEQALIRCIVDLEKLRRSCSVELYQLNELVAKAASNEKTARQLLVETGSAYGFAVPSPLPSRPFPKASQHQFNVGNWYDLTFSKIYQMQLSEHQKQHSLAIPESIQSLMPLPEPAAPIPASEPAANAVAEQTDVAETDPDLAGLGIDSELPTAASTVDPFEFLQDAK